MKRIDKLYYRLLLIVVTLLLYRGIPSVIDTLPKEQVVDYHGLYVTYPMLEFVDNKDQLAAVIGHELGHIILGHTMREVHKAEDEYHADLIGMFLAHKAGYSLCGVDKLWRKMGENYMSLYTNSHPNAFVRAYYLEMPECKGVEINKEVVTHSDAVEIFKRMSKNVEGRIRYKTIFDVYYLTGSVNAFVFTETKDRE